MQKFVVLFLSTLLLATYAIRIPALPQAQRLDTDAVDVEYNGTDVADMRDEQVFRVKIENLNQKKIFEKMVVAHHVDVWTFASTVQIGDNDVRLNKKNSIHREILKILKRENISFSLFIDNIQQYIEKEREVANAQSFYGSYHKYEEMVAYANALCIQYSNKCQWIASIGKSVQGRDIFLLRLGVTPVTKTKPVIYFQGGQHAREWISPITVMYVVEQLLSSTDPTIASFLNEVIIDVVIHLNPDGYFYTWQNSNNRLWRKNRKLVAANIYGVDLNRNWADHWGGEGSSGTPSSDTYRGTGPFSEPETKAVLDWISFTQKTLVIIGGIDFHSYSQLILRPYGWTYENSPDEAALNAMGAGMATAIKESFGKVYVNQKAIGLYPASGTAEDWFYSAGIRFSYTIELRDTGLYGFLLPADQILPTAQEIWNSMIFYIQNTIEQSK